VLLAAFEWSIIDVVTGFLFGPLQGVAWLLLLVGLIWAIVVRVRSTVPGRAASYPLLICVAGIATALYVPWTTLWLAANERVHRTDRERIVRQVQEGSLRPNVSYNGSLIALKSGSPDVSKGGMRSLWRSTMVASTCSSTLIAASWTTTRAFSSYLPELIRGCSPVLQTYRQPWNREAPNGFSWCTGKPALIHPLVHPAVIAKRPAMLTANGRAPPG
jgi:hypothetical protein